MTLQLGSLNTEKVQLRIEADFVVDVYGFTRSMRAVADHPPAHVRAAQKRLKPQKPRRGRGSLYTFDVQVADSTTLHHMRPPESSCPWHCKPQNDDSRIQSSTYPW